MKKLQTIKRIKEIGTMRFVLMILSALSIFYVTVKLVNENMSLGLLLFHALVVFIITIDWNINHQFEKNEKTTRT